MDDSNALFILLAIFFASFYYLFVRPVYNFHKEAEIFAMKSRLRDPDYDYHGNAYIY